MAFQTEFLAERLDGLEQGRTGPPSVAVRRNANHLPRHPGRMS
jgi:hypothetical protein